MISQSAIGILFIVFCIGHPSSKKLRTFQLLEYLQQCNVLLVQVTIRQMCYITVRLKQSCKLLALSVDDFPV